VATSHAGQIPPLWDFLALAAALLANQSSTGVRMPEYRIYNLEQNGQLVIARVDLMFESDEIAISQAEKLIVGDAVEVWQGDRLVAMLNF
jgi:hypothetical protein